MSDYSEPVDTPAPARTGGFGSVLAIGAPATNTDGDTVRGLKMGWGQASPILKGAVGLVGATAEKALGEGGISTAVKDWGLHGYEEGMKKLEPLQHENDDVTVAWDKARQGDVGAMVDWAQYAFGYGVSQVAQSAAVGIGSGIIGGAMSGGVAAAPAAIAGAVEKTAAQGLIRGMVEKEIAKRAAASLEGVVATDAMKVAAQRAATKSLAADVGALTGLTGMNVGQEAGQIFPAAIDQAKKEGRELTGSDLARVWGSSVIAGASETVPEAIGMGAFFGNFGALGKRISAGLGSTLPRRIATGALAGTALESGQEGFQTVVEHYGAGQPLADEEGTKDIINSMAMAAVPGAVFGAGAGLHRVGSPKISGAKSVDEAIEAFKLEVSSNAAQFTENKAALERAFHNDAQVAEDQAALEKAFESNPAFSPDEQGNPAAYGATLRAIAPQDLPPQRALDSSNPEGLSRDAFEALSALAQAQGKRLVVYADHPNLPDGAVNAAATPGIVFISDHTSVDAAVVAAHEVQHLSEQGDKQAEFVRVVNEELTANATELAHQRHDTEDAEGNVVPMSDAKLLEEIRGDIAGDAVADPHFWGRVVDNMNLQLGAEAAESHAATFLQSIASLIARVRATLKGMTFTTADGARIATSYVKNLERVHSALAAAIADRFLQQGFRPPGATTNSSQHLVQRAIALQADKAAATATPELQRTAEQAAALNARPIVAPEGLSPALVSALAAAQKAPADRTPEERIELEAVRVGLRISPKGAERAKLAAMRTRTPEFKQWFGKSKVVDRSGAPLVVYHGDYQDIKVPRGRFWGSSSPAVADTYAITRAGEEGGANTIPAYFALKNPMVVDADGLDFDDIPFRGKILRTDDIADIAEKEGHDGVVFKNVFDHSETGKAVGLATSYVAFNPAQVKSVFNAKPTNRASLSHSPKQSERAKIEAGRRGASLAAVPGAPAFSRRVIE